MTDNRARFAPYFVDENREGEPTVVVSPSGRFRLTIQTYRTAPGRWHYTRGTVTRIADGAVISDIQRNLGNFHHSFVMKDGREYLITGRSYMSQTIVDLDRGVEHEPPGDQYDGFAFCWAKCTLSPDGNTLAVDGCIWACPYEYRFFDFTDPSKGWPALPVVGVERIEEPSDKRASAWVDAVTFDCFQYDIDHEPQERTRVQRRGGEMVVVEYWLSNSERARRDTEARAEAEQDAWWETFSSADPVYRHLREGMQERTLPCDNLGYHPGDRTILLRFRRVQPPASADLRWDTEASTMSVQSYDTAGNRTVETSFEASIAGVDAALDLVAKVFARR